MLIPRALHPEMERHRRRMATTDQSVLRDLNALIIALEENGVWDQFDTLCVVTDLQADSLLDLKANADAVNVGPSTFIGNQGFSTNASAGQYIDTRFLHTAFTRFQANNAGLFYWVQTGATPGSNQYTCGAMDSDGAFSNYLYNTDAYSQWQGSAGASVSEGASTPTGFHYSGRSSANEINQFNGVRASTTNSTTTGLTFRQSAFLGTYNYYGAVGPVAGYNARYCGWGFGSLLNATDTNALYAALTAYLTSRGAI